MTTEELIAARRAEPWREALRKSKKNKERADIPRVKMNELDPEYRSRTRLEEVNLGLTKEQAMQEAERCLDCPNPTCMQGCPVNINIPTFIKNIERGEFLEAAKTLKETSALPAVCGRVCPQEKQCESKCIHLKMSKEAVAIGYLERFAADYERESGNISVPEIAEKNGIKIAVVGSGPAGLSFAGDMAKRGYDVTVFEALHEIGGVLKYGIPEFRLPNKIVDVEIDGLRKMGVQFEKDCIVGKTISYDDLHADGFKGVFVASGAGLPNFMNIPGENFVGVMSSNEYLTRVNLMDAANPESDTPVLQGKKVAVIGGGNTALQDAEFLSNYCNKVYVVHRRDEFRGESNLVDVLKEKDNVEFVLDSIVKDIEGKFMVERLFLRNKKTGEDFHIPVSGVFVAIGQIPQNEIFDGLVRLDENGFILASEDCMTSHPGIFAAGDCRTKEVRQLTTAAADGSVAALAACKYLSMNF